MPRKSTPKSKSRRVRELLDTEETASNGQRNHDRRGRFKKGNVAARGNGQRSRAAAMRAVIAETFEARLPELAAVIVERASRGDVRMMRLACEFAIGKPIPLDDRAAARIADRVSELVEHAHAIEPRPDITRPDAKLIQDAATLAELALPADGWADALGVDREKFAAWVSAGEKKPDSICGRLVHAVRAASARAQLRLAVRAEHAPLGVLERRDPDNFGRHQPRPVAADPDQFDEADRFA